MAETATVDYTVKALNCEPDFDIFREGSIPTNIKNLLANASKKGSGFHGSLDICVIPKDSSLQKYILIVECKWSATDHESPHFKNTEPDQKNASKYAVDGALWYAKYLCKEYNVIAIGVSGEPGSIVVSSFLWKKGANSFEELFPRQSGDFSVKTVCEYFKKAVGTPVVKTEKETLAFAANLHEILRDKAKLSESEKPLLVSGTLLALQSEKFKTILDTKASQVHVEWFQAIKESLESKSIPEEKRKLMERTYDSIANHPNLKNKIGSDSSVLKFLSIALRNFFELTDHALTNFDFIGSFYGEFLKYTGGDKKSLGIVLTPRHITELFSAIASVDKNTRVFDPCTGTGGFLVSAMHRMLIGSSEEESKNIKSHNLVGVEADPKMFTLAASNMILRGDGQSNIYHGSCFDKEIMSKVKGKNCNVGMVNPPYGSKNKDEAELKFVKAMLDCLSPGGIGIAIVPLSCAIGTDKNTKADKQSILDNHSLVGVMTMSPELFYPTGTNTCIMVFTAGVPNGDNKTWFANWKNDGFVKTKNAGRSDIKNTWPEKMKEWVSAFKDKDQTKGILKHVEATDEWLWEAYASTDYSTITPEDFFKTAYEFSLYSNMLYLEGDFILNGEIEQ